MNKRLAPICFASVDSESEAPFTRYIGLSNRFDNRMYRVNDASGIDDDTRHRSLLELSVNA